MWTPDQMTIVLLALAGIAAVATAAHAAPAAPVAKRERPIVAKTTPKPPTKPKTAPKPAVQPEIEIVPSAEAMRVADWVAQSGDNRSLPYAIIDKINASLLMFNAKGVQTAAVPVLIGIATGDDATPGVGSKNLAEIGPSEKTTPAGRFVAKFGLAFGRERILWVDYATSVALHTIPTTVSKKEGRRERMLSPSPDDNRITFGCINVPVAFYGKTLRPAFQRKGGIVYILPDTKPIEEVFPRLRVQAVLNASAG
jgi:hypothetical protein